MKCIIPLIISMTFFFGCTKSVVIHEVEVVDTIQYYPLTSKLINEYNLEESDLLGLQIYTSSDIVLHKQSSNKTSEVKDGTLIINKNNETNEIIIKSHTPCIVVQSNKDFIVVEFENDYKLTFIISDSECCENRWLYYLSANKWNQGIGTLFVKGIQYQAIGLSGESYLMINKKILESGKPNLILLEGKLINHKI